MISGKVCMLGDFGVGKTSLVRQFVDQSFSDKYLTTVGVKIDTKTVALGDGGVKLVIWDIAGSATIGSLQKSYMQGMAGYVLVCDGTRAPTLNTANKLRETLAEHRPELPFCMLVNKMDLVDQTEVSDEDIAALVAQGWEVLRSSAKTGENVENAFRSIAERMHRDNGK